MSADASGLRSRLVDWQRRTVQAAGEDAVRAVTSDRDVAAQSQGPGAARLGARMPDRVTARSTGARAEVRVEGGGWQWMTGGPMRPFDPHARLIGTKFSRPDDPKLANPGSWPPVAHFHPGDHKGCRCRTVPARVPADRRLWVPALRRALTAGLRSAARRIRI